MLEFTSQSAERRHLLLSDGQSSLTALTRSLAGKPLADGEALLYASDLASMFSGLGLKDAAQLLKDFAHGLSEDPDAALETSRSLLPKLKPLMDAIEAEDPVRIDAARQALLNAVPSPTLARMAEETSPAMPVTMIDPSASASPPEKPFVPASPTPPGEPPVLTSAWAEQPTFFSAGLSAAPYLQDTPTSSHRANSGEEPLNWSEVRLQALQNVQEACAMAAAQQPESLALQVKLQAVQDGLMRVGQLPLNRVYPEVPGAQDLWVDPPLIELLDHLLVFSQRAQRIVLQLRNLTLFATWVGTTLSHAERQHVGDKVAQASGRLDVTGSSVELVLPISAQRMRMVSFEQEGQWHAHPWAQFLGWDSSPLGLSIQLRCGTQDKFLKVSQQGTVAPMNLYPWPAIVPAPVQIGSIAIDGRGQIHVVYRDFA